MIRWLQRYRNELFIFLVLLISYSYFMPRWADWNQNSRLNLVRAIVEEQTLRIDTYVANTGDYALFDGHYYSDKAPGTAFLAVPVYFLARPLLQSPPSQALLERLAQSDAFGETLNDAGNGLRQEKIYAAVVHYLVTFVVVSLPAAVLGVLIYGLLGHVNQRLNQRAGWRIGIALLYGLATPAFPYSGALYGHQIVAVLLFGAFYLMFLIGQQRVAQWLVVLVGAMLGYAVITEYPAVLIAAVIALYALIRLPNRFWIAGLVIGGVFPGLLAMTHNWAIFGTILPVGYEHSELWTDVHQQGFMSLVGPHAPALWGITFGTYRGLFFLAPVLLLALPGFVVWWQQRVRRWEWAVCLWAVSSFLLFNGSSVMWEGGFAVGPRYLVPMLPFMAVAVGMLVEYWERSSWVRLLVTVLSIWSVLVVWAQTIGGQSFPGYTPNPLLTYSLPHLLRGDVARNLGMVVGQSGLSSLLPLCVALLLLAGGWYLRGRDEHLRVPTAPVPFVADNRPKEVTSDG